MTNPEQVEKVTQQGGDGDPAMAALATLSEATRSSIAGLEEVQEQIEGARRRRRRGWSWHRIAAAPDTKGLLRSATDIAANLSSAGGRFRRSLAIALRAEGVRTTEIADSMGVTRQRVSSLTRGTRKLHQQ